MDSLYSAPQPYAVYEHHHRWIEDSKPNYGGDEHDITLVNKSLNPQHMVNSSSGMQGVGNSALKVEDELSARTTPTPASTAQMWHQRPNEHHPVRSHSTSHALAMNGTSQPFVQLNNPAFTMHHAHTWSVPHSGTSTPTPLYTQVYDMPFSHGTSGFAVYPPDPPSAVSMSPQSSQGGWASAASSDGADQRGMISPIYRPTSPGTVVRPDGIRKKNARFEIPKERNLANIDAMILASTDENEKKELKQQKRLLRNRQAALDSRQRKKTHTEKLEQEKKVSEKKMIDMEEHLAQTESDLNVERTEYITYRHNTDALLHALQYERDEAIRTKTLETAELRRQNNVLKECVRELERQMHKGYAPVSNMNHYNGDVSEFGFEDNWDDESNWLNHDDLKMDDSDALQRQATPKPPSSTMRPVIESKSEGGFSLTTFYTCLLFGAFIAANSNKSVLDNSAASALTSSVPASEASNVIKTVLGSGSVSTDIFSAHADQVSNGATGERNSIRSPYEDSHAGPTSSLDQLHQSLSSPTRRQEMAAAFSLSASSYQHLTDPFNEHIHIDTNHNLLEPPAAPQPSALQKAFANMQAQKDNIDKITGMGSKARERSLIWDQVPAEVIKNFEALVQSSANSNSNTNGLDRMEQ